MTILLVTSTRAIGSGRGGEQVSGHARWSGAICFCCAAPLRSNCHDLWMEASFAFTLLSIAIKHAFVNTIQVQVLYDLHVGRKPLSS